MYILAFYVDINGLNDVLCVLRKHGFATASQWRPLCLNLGLTYNTLSNIENDYRGQVERQLEEGISEWLRKKYDQRKYDPPSWRVLVKALRNISEIATAEGIENEKLTSGDPSS